MSAPVPASFPKKATKPWFRSTYALRFWESLAPLIFPPVCVLCGEATGRVTAENSTRRYATFCNVCETSLVQSRPMMRTACDRCGWPRVVRSPRTHSPAPPADPPSDFEITSGVPDLLPCPKCHARSNPHHFSRITPLYRYHEAARTAVVAAKYPCNSAVTRELATRLAQRCRDRWPDRTADAKAAAVPMVVTSVPSPWIRQIRRGGSGTRLLAQYTAMSLNSPYVSLLQTTRSVAKQALLDDDARRDNVDGAFRVCRRWRKTSLDCDVLLVDDVMTTGATADEVARVLIGAGARRVLLAVVALAMRDA